MRFLLKCRVPMEEGNAAVRDGTLGETIQSIMEDIKPEAAYFTDVDGARGGYFIVHMENASELPAIAEPLFLGLGASIEAHVVMTPEDLQNATPALEQAAQKYTG